jgi:hypothetical protein
MHQLRPLRLSSDFQQGLKLNKMAKDVHKAISRNSNAHNNNKKVE